jgi:hypothetical protein
LFDQLLPAVGDRLLDYIRSHVQRESVGIHREEQRITAYFDFFRENPGFLRILNEAEVFAPSAFRQHLKNFTTNYVASLKRHSEHGELGRFGEDEFEAVVYMLMGARSYLTLLWRGKGSAARKDGGKSLIATYVKIVNGGLFASNRGLSEGNHACTESRNRGNGSVRRRATSDDPGAL